MTDIKKKDFLKIEIDSRLLQEGITQATNESIKDACGSYQIKEAIKKSLNQSILLDVIKSGIDASLQALDLKHITQAIAKEYTKTIIAATTITLKESAIQTIIKIRGISDYSDEGKTEIKQLREEFFPLLKKEKADAQE